MAGALPILLAALAALARASEEVVPESEKTEWRYYVNFDADTKASFDVHEETVVESSHPTSSKFPRWARAPVDEIRWCQTTPPITTAVCSGLPASPPCASHVLRLSSPHACLCSAGRPLPFPAAARCTASSSLDVPDPEVLSLIAQRTPASRVLRYLL